MTKNNPWLKLLYCVIIIAGALAMLLPFLWMISTSLKTTGTALTLPPSFIPHPIEWENYARVWLTVNFFRSTLNSTFVTILDILGTLAACSVAAYGLAMFEFKGRTLIFMVMLASLMLPAQVTLIPHYFIWKELGALDTFVPLIVPSYFGSAFGIFLMHQFFKSLPKELYDAAWVDGANPFRILYAIYLPLAKPALAALGLFTFMGAWNNTITPLIYLQSKELYTLPLALLFLKSDPYNNDVNLLMAGSIIVTLPVIIVFLFAQKQFIQGIASTGLKA